MSDDFVGRHWTGFEEPDLLRMKLTGIVREAEARELNRLHQGYVAGRGRVFYLIDLEDLETIEPGARKEAGDGLQQLELGGIAIYEAPLKARVLAKLIFTAMNMFRRGGISKVPFEFHDSEASARAWIAERRKLLLAEPPKTEPEPAFR
jgi:hypothetical protein